MDTFRTIISEFLVDLRAQKLRAFLTMFGIIWGTVAIVVLIAFGVGFKKQTAANMLVIGYAWLLLLGLEPAPRRWAFRLTAAAYGVASALILDEFALWLNLKDVYWQKQGRESVEALALFGGLLLWAALIAPFAQAVWRHLRAELRSRRSG